MINFQDIKKNPYLYTELAEEFYNQGHEVYIATILEDKCGKETIYKNEYGLDVLRIHTGDMFNVNMLKKGITTMLIPSIFKRAINKYFKNLKFDLVIYPTPPITFATLVKYIKRHCNCKTYLILRDIFPQNALDLGVIKNRFIFNYFRRKEKTLYMVSDKIGCMSQGNIEYVIKNNQINKDKLEVLYNWTKVNREEGNIKDIDIREKYGWKNKLIAIHGGNIGPAQELEFLIELIKEYRNDEDIRFLIIGKGTESNKIKKLIKENSLENVVLEDYIESSQFNNIVKQCDIGLVNLNRNFVIPNFPSKTLTYFKCKIPILASIDKNTDYGEFLDSVGAGVWCLTGNVNEYKKKFNLLTTNKKLRSDLGNRGFEFLKKYLDVHNAYKIIMKSTEKV